MGHVVHPTHDRGSRFSRVRWQQGARLHMPIQVDTKPGPLTTTHNPPVDDVNIRRVGLVEPCLRGVRTFSRGGEPMRVQLLAQRVGQVVVSSTSNILICLRLDRAATRHTETEQHARSHDDHEPRTPHRRPLSSRRATAHRSGRYASMVPAPLAHPHRTVTIATKTRSSSKKGRASSLRLVRSLPSQPMVIKRCPSNQSDVSSSLLTSTSRRARAAVSG